MEKYCFYKDFCLQEEWLEWGALLTIVLFVFALLALWGFFKWAPDDFFLRQQGFQKYTNKFGKLLGSLVFFVKNLIAFLLFLVGIVFLMTPGQGLLTILLGLSFLDFPGKKNLKNKILQKKSVQIKINQFRKKMGANCFQFPN